MTTVKAPFSIGKNRSFSDNFHKQEMMNALYLNHRLQLRKNKLSWNFLQKRSIIPTDTPDLSQIINYIDTISSTEHEDTLIFLLSMIRKYLSLPHLSNDEVSHLISIGLVDKIITLLKKEKIQNNCNCLNEIFWILVNITGTDTAKYTELLINKGILEILEVIKDNTGHIFTNDVIEMFSWLIANLAQNSANFRKQLAEKKILLFLIIKLGQNYSKDTIEHILVSINYILTSVSLKNYCDEEKMLISYLIPKIINYTSSKEIHAEINPGSFIAMLLSLGKIITNNVNILMIIERSNCIPQLFQFLITENAQNWKVKYNIFRFFGDIAFQNNNTYALFLLQHNILELFILYLENKEKIPNDIIKEIFYIISNLEVCEEKTDINVRYFFSSPHLIDLLFECIQSPLPQNVLKECLYSICNLTITSKVEEMNILIQKGIIEFVIAKVILNDENNKDFSVYGICFEALLNILAFNNNTQLKIQERLNGCNMKEIMEKIWRIDNDSPKGKFLNTQTDKILSIMEAME